MNTDLWKKIESRCVEVGDCLEWQGHISAGGSPRMYHDGKTQSARKLVLQAHGKPSEVPPKHKLVCTCENHRCVNVDHIAIVPLAKFVRERLVANTNHQIRAAKIAKARQDFLHKASTDIVRRFDYIAVGNVSSGKLAKTKMAKSVYDASWHSFKKMLAYKSIANGAWYEEVNEAFSSVTCSSCNARSGPSGLKGLQVRQWICAECGCVHDRDQNAALNILARAGHRTPVEGIRLL